MFLRKFNRTGKLLAFIGIWFFAFGITFNKTIGISESPDSLTLLSVPFIVVGILLLVESNFFKVKSHK